MTASRPSSEKTKSPAPSPIASLAGSVPNMLPGIPAISSISGNKPDEKLETPTVPISMPPINLANFEINRENAVKTETEPKPNLLNGFSSTKKSPVRYLIILSFVYLEGFPCLVLTILRKES